MRVARAFGAESLAGAQTRTATADARRSPLETARDTPPPTCRSSHRRHMLSTSRAQQVLIRCESPAARALYPDMVGWTPSDPNHDRCDRASPAQSNTRRLRYFESSTASARL